MLVGGQQGLKPPEGDLLPLPAPDPSPSSGMVKPGWGISHLTELLSASPSLSSIQGGTSRAPVIRWGSTWTTSSSQSVKPQAKSPLPHSIYVVTGSEH